MALTNLVPIRVKIKRGLKNGKWQHKYPDFNLVSSAIRNNLDWAVYLDAYGIGWHYDRLCGFNETDSYNTDSEVWYGCTCVPSDFANDAVSRFPDDVEILSEAAFETFYDERAHVHDTEETYDINALQGIKLKQQLGGKLNQSDKDAMNPEKSTPGILKNHGKTWALYKAKKNITIDE